jgi:hypothetical protein
MKSNAKYLPLIASPVSLAALAAIAILTAACNLSPQTVSDPTKVGGLDFDRFRIPLAVKGKPAFIMYLLAKLYKGYDFGITYLYTDDRAKTQMENILAGSKFE